MTPDYWYSQSTGIQIGRLVLSFTDQISGVVLASFHGKGVDPQVRFEILNLDTNKYEPIDVDYNIDSEGNIAWTSLGVFSGKLIII